jgi:hypothetical protein
MKTSTQGFSIKHDDGTKVTVHLPQSVIDGPSGGIVARMVGADGPASITRDEWEKIKDIRVQAPGDIGQTALIVRFDMKWVRIDEAGLSWDESQEIARGHDFIAP